jgi:hypothetical protein
MSSIQKLLMCSAVFVIAMVQGCATTYHGKWVPPIHNGDTDTIQSYIDKGDHLTDRDDIAGETPLHLAAKFGNAKIVRQLLDAGAPVDDPGIGRIGRTPLNAASAGSKDVSAVIAVLLEHGADIQTWDFISKTPLENAVLNSKNVAALLSAGADPLIYNNSGSSVKDLFIRSKAIYKGAVAQDISVSIAMLDTFIAPHIDVGRCKKMKNLQLKTSCYAKHINKFPYSVTTSKARNTLDSLKLQLAAFKKEKATKANVKKIRLAKIKKERLANQACRLNAGEWIYLSKSCHKGLAHGQGEAINDAKNLKFIGQFKQGERTIGELYVNNQLMYDGPIKSGRPHGAGTCIHEGEPEECKYYKGKRTDVLYKQRLEFVKQRKLMASSEARINQSLKSSEKRIDDRLSDFKTQTTQRNSNGGNSFGDYALDAAKKKGASMATDALFDALF